MSFSRLIRMIPESKRKTLSDALVDFILTSKNDAKMPSTLAHTLLHHWQSNQLETEHGLANLLEASVLLEPEKTVAVLNEFQLTDIAEKIGAKISLQGR